MRKILSLCNTKNVLEKISRENNCLEKYEKIDNNLKELLEKCLTISPRERLIPHEVMLQLANQTNIENVLYQENPPPKSMLMQLPLTQIYYLWQLAGGDVLSELKKEGLIRSEAPILSMPK